MSLSAGRLRHRINLWEYENGKSPGGVPTRTPVKRRSCWASLDESLIVRINDSTALAASTDERVFTIRYRKGINTNWLVEFDDALHKIASVSNPDGRNVELLISTKGIQRYP